MAKKAAVAKTKVDPAVAAMLAGIIYQAKLTNRQAKVSVPEDEVLVEVMSLWRIVMDAMKSDSLPGLGA